MALTDVTRAGEGIGSLLLAINLTDERLTMVKKICRV
jgi:hypothetical protein